MTVQFINKEQHEVTFKVTAPDAEFDKAIETAYRKNRGKINIPGFRNGKAPRKIIERYYGENVFYEDALDAIIPNMYEAAVKELKLEPVAQPDVDIDQIDERPLILSFKVTVKPEVALGAYKGVSAVKPEYHVTDDDILNELKRKQDSSARLIDVTEGACENGDSVHVSYVGRIDGVEFEGGTSDGMTIELGAGRMIPGFEEQIVGHNLDESFAINVTFPEDYGAQDLAGKAAEFTITILGIKRKELSPLDDEFAKDVSEFDTLEEYKVSIRERLYNENKERAQSQFTDNVLRVVSDNATVDIPDVMVQNEITSEIQRRSRSLMQYGIDPARMFEIYGTTESEFRANSFDNAKESVKYQLVIEAVSKDAAIEISDEDVNAEYDKMSTDRSIPVDRLKTFIPADEVRDQLRMRRAIDLMTESAVALPDASEPIAE